MVTAVRAPLRRAQRVVGQVGAFSYIVAPAGGRLPWVAEEWRGAERKRVRRYATEEAADARVDSWMNMRTLLEAYPL